MVDENKKKDAVSMDDLQEEINKLKEKETVGDGHVQPQTDDDKACPECNRRDAKIEELTTALTRAMADLQNYKRRTEQEQGQFVKFANAELLKEILPIIDNFDRCTNHLPNELKEDDWAKGVIQIHDNLLKTLEKMGIAKIKTVNEKLNPNFHEALMSGPGKKDTITEEFEPGYTLNGEVIKPAKVKVGDGSKKKNN